MNTLDLLKLTKDQKIIGVWLSGTPGEGEFKQWYKNGQLYIKEFYKNDELHGEYLEWYDNGKLNVKAFWKNGKRISYDEYS